MTIDQVVSLASAPPAELGLFPPKPKAAAAPAEAPAEAAPVEAAAAAPAKGPPAELGLGAPAKGPPAELGLGAPKPAAVEKEAPAKAENEEDAKPKAPKAIPAELGFLPKKAPAADAGDKGDGGAGDKDAADKGDGGAGDKIDGGAGDKAAKTDIGDGVSKGSMSKDWPLDNFPSGVYAPNGFAYPLQKVSPLGKMNEFTGLLENPDGTTSFPDGTMVDAPNTWLMTEENVQIPIDEYKEENTMAENEQH
jgi:hypothetical protein